jgi:hypothetical protein
LQRPHLFEALVKLFVAVAPSTDLATKDQQQQEKKQQKNFS